MQRFRVIQIVQALNIYNIIVPLMQSSSVLDEFRIVRDLGRGGQAVVKLGELKGKYYAIKIYLNSEDNYDLIENQLKILRSLDHPNILKLYDARKKAQYRQGNSETHSCLALVLQYLSGGQLFGILSATGRFAQPLARAYFITIIKALEYMHGLNIAHRDLKPENIVLDQKFNLKIIDFGHGNFFKPNSSNHTICGTAHYVPPEVWAKNYKSHEVDIFAAGVILFCMLLKLPPFTNTKPSDAHYSAFKNPTNRPVYWAHYRQKLAKQNVGIPQQFIDLMEKMLHPIPEQRLTINQILNHPWVKGEIYAPSQIQQYFANRYQRLKEQQEQLNQANLAAQQHNINQQNNGMRSGETDNAQQILGLIKLNTENLKTQTQIKPSDYIISESPTKFLIYLYQFLCFKQKNILLDESEEQNFLIETSQETDEVKIRLMYNEFGSDLEAGVVLKLTKTEDERLKIEFLREEDDDRLISYEIINALKNQFEYLKKQE